MVTTPVPNGVSPSQNGNVTKKTESVTQDKTIVGDSRRKSREEISKNRNEAKSDADGKKGARNRNAEKDVKSTSSVLPPPPNRDEEAWPTPETVIDGDRKKALERGEKVEKERKDGPPTATHGKHEWVKVAYTPSVVFNTPLPNAVNARRGGRPGGRGGAQNAVGLLVQVVMVLGSLRRTVQLQMLLSMVNRQNGRPLKNPASKRSLPTRNQPVSKGPRR